MGFLGGSRRGHQNGKTDSRAYDFQRWLLVKGLGHQGPPEAHSGRPKGPGDIGKMGFGNGPFQNVWFY